MIDKNLTDKYREDPVLLDSLIDGIREKLKSDLVWLDHAFGRAYRMTRYTTEGKKDIYPAFYNGNGEYLSLEPNDNYGNFCWFDIYDPQTISIDIPTLPSITYSGAVVFWYNLETIFNDKNFIYSENVKQFILQTLTGPGMTQGKGRLRVTAVYESMENIYKGYYIEKIYNNFNYTGQDISSRDKMFFMYPYAGLRIEFEITVKEKCLK